MSAGPPGRSAVKFVRSEVTVKSSTVNNAVCHAQLTRIKYVTGKLTIDQIFGVFVLVAHLYSGARPRLLYDILHRAVSISDIRTSIALVGAVHISEFIGSSGKHAAPADTEGLIQEGRKHSRCGVGRRGNFANVLVAVVEAEAAVYSCSWTG